MLFRSVIDGPFTETKELVAGYWIWQVKSLDEAVEWVRRCPDPMPGEESEIEIRPFFEPEDFPADYAPDFKAYEERLEKGEALVAEAGVEHGLVNDGNEPMLVLVVVTPPPPHGPGAAKS